MRKATFMSLTIVAITLLLIPVGASAQPADFVDNVGCSVDSGNEFQLYLLPVIPNQEVGGYDFTYEVGPNADNKITHALVSQRCDSENPIDGRADCAEGVSNTIWGKGDHNVSISIFEPTAAGEHGQFIIANAPNTKMGFVSFIFTTGRKEYVCGEIMGPGNTDLTASVTSSQTFTLPPLNSEEGYCDLEIEFNPLSAEIVLPADESDPNYDFCSALKTNSENSNFVPIGQIVSGKVHVTDNTIEITSHSPTCYTYYYNGYAKQFCYGY